MLIPGALGRDCSMCIDINPWHTARLAQTACGKTSLVPQNFDGLRVWDNSVCLVIGSSDLFCVSG